jgi:lantibiotic biosynthesis protein
MRLFLKAVKKNYMHHSVQQTFNQLHKIITNHTPKDDTLFSGNLGMALYYIDLYKTNKLVLNAEKAIDYIEKVLDNIHQNDFGFFGTTFCNGAAGLGYIVESASKENLVEIDEASIKKLDEYLYTYTKQQLIHTNRHDFLHGAIGVIYYFTTKLPDPIVATYCYELVQLFCDKAQYNEQGTWFKNVIIEEDKEEDINFSLSHGQSSFIIVLCLAYSKGILVENIPLLVKKGIDLLMHYKSKPNFDEQKFSIFPTSIVAGKPVFSSRLAWCYGDLNIALALYHAGTIFKNDAWINIANEVTEISMSREDELSNANVDSHICHGTAGLAQLYKAIYDITKDEKHKSAWHHWVQKTVEIYLLKELENNFYKGKECELFEGLVGVNLCLLSYLSNENLHWNKILLL